MIPWGRHTELRGITSHSLSLRVDRARSNPPLSGGLDLQVRVYGVRLPWLSNIDVSGKPVEHQLRVPSEVVVALEPLVRAFDPEELLVL